MLPLGSISGVTIGARWTLLVAVAGAVWVFGLLDGTMAALGLCASVLAHELAHAWMARKRNVGVAGIELGAFGGSTALVNSPESARHELAISLAGPCASAIITLVTGLLAWASENVVVGALFFANAVLFISNAAPLLPLDGGRACRAFLVARGIDRISATKHVSFLNYVVATACVVVGVIVSSAITFLFGAPLIATGVFIALLGALEVRRVANEAARATALRDLAFDPMDAPWARR